MTMYRVTDEIWRWSTMLGTLPTRSPYVIANQRCRAFSVGRRLAEFALRIDQAAMPRLPEALAPPELRLGLRRWRIGLPMRSWFTHRRVGLVRAKLDTPFVVQYLGVVAVEHLGNTGRDAVSMVPCDRWSPDCGTIVRIACESLAIHVEQDQAGCGRILPSEKVELRSHLRSMRG